MTSLTHELPIGYTFAVTERITAEQVGVLYFPRFEDAYSRQHMANAYSDIDAKYAARDVQSMYIGVMAADVGVVAMAGLRYDATHGELNSLAVLPDYRRQGIGKWLVDERLRRAQAVGLAVLFVERIDSTNTLASYYGDCGFSTRNNHDGDVFFSRRKLASESRLIRELTGTQMHVDTSQRVTS